MSLFCFHQQRRNGLHALGVPTTPVTSRLGKTKKGHTEPGVYVFVFKKRTGSLFRNNKRAERTHWIKKQNDSRVREKNLLQPANNKAS